MLFDESFVRLVIYSLFVLFVMAEFISLGRFLMLCFEGYDEGAKGVST